jgi:hypothetical protein
MARVWWSDAVLYYTLTIYTVRGTLITMLFGLKRGYAPCIMAAEALEGEWWEGGTCGMQSAQSDEVRREG